MKILSLESSGLAASAAVLHDGKILSEFFSNVSLTHSQTLMPMAEMVMKLAGCSSSDIDYFAVTSGPGSFTGLRIGISSVKGLAFGANKPCIPVSSLEAAAWNFAGEEREKKIICVSFDARCEQVYSALFRISGGTVIRLSEDAAEPVEQTAARLTAYDNVTLCGDGAHLVLSAAKAAGIDDAKICSETRRYPRASSLAICAAANVSRAVSADELSAVYLRLPQAERERLRRENDFRKQ